MSIGDDKDLSSEIKERYLSIRKFMTVFNIYIHLYTYDVFIYNKETIKQHQTFEQPLISSAK
jgi:hypothetical protein